MSCIGIGDPDEFYKAIWWSNNPFGNLMAHMLDELVEIGCLQKRDKPDWQYRWNPEFQDLWQEYDKWIENRDKNNLSSNQSQNTGD